MAITLEEARLIAQFEAAVVAATSAALTIQSLALSAVDGHIGSGASLMGTDAASLMSGSTGHGGLHLRGVGGAVAAALHMHTHRLPGTGAAPTPLPMPRTLADVPLADLQRLWLRAYARLAKDWNDWGGATTAPFFAECALTSAGLPFAYPALTAGVVAYLSDAVVSPCNFITLLE